MYWKQSEASDVVTSGLIHDGDGPITRRPLFAEASRLPIRLEVWELEPGASEGSHVHKAPNPLEEIYYFIRGEGEMQVDRESVPISAGDAIMVPPGADHGFRNTGSGPLKLVIIWGDPQGPYAEAPLSPGR